MEPPKVIEASKERRDAVISTITLGFATDPVARWTWPDPAVFLETYPKFAAAFGGRGFDHGTVFQTECGRAAAMWLPPEVYPDSDGIGMAVASSIPEERMGEIGMFFGQMEQYHPKEPCWYLPMIAADPAATGQGLGAALMKHALAIVDESKLPAYLESSNPRNISLYERHGFEVMGEIKVDGSPVMTPMIRAARG